MAIASVTYNTAGSVGPYTITFPYLEEADIDVTLNGAVLTAFTFTSATQITLDAAPGASTVLVITRDTADDPYVDFTAPGPVVPEDLDTATLQAIYIAQEAVDGAAAALAAVSGAGNVPAPAAGDVGQFLKATAVNTFSFESVSVVAADISDSTVTGRALVTAATAAAARTTLDVPSNAEAILDSLMDAKGDLLAGTADNTVARVAIGANRTILEADSVETPGIKWVARALGLKSVQIFTASDTWTRPTGIRKVVVEVVGGGGSGGGTAATTASAAGGGGGGGFSTKLIDVSAIATATVTVGAGGAAPAAGAGPGNVGVASSWADGTDTLTGNGGAAGPAPAASAGGAGGTGTGGDLNLSGGRGGTAAVADVFESPHGGASQRGKGGGAPTRDAAGLAGELYGGGGSGARGGASAAARAGGAGADGIVIVYEYE